VNIDELTLGQIKEIQALACGQSRITQSHPFVGKKVIIRTQNAGVHFGTLVEKEGREVVLSDARRLWLWKTANKGISLSEVANAGLLSSASKTCSPVPLLWLEAIEIIPCSAEASKNIEGQDEYRA